MQKINYLNVQLWFCKVCCYLYRKRSNTNNVNAEAKEQGRDMQTPIDDSGIFTEVSRTIDDSGIFTEVARSAHASP